MNAIEEGVMSFLAFTNREAMRRLIGKCQEKSAQPVTFELAGDQFRAFEGARQAAADAAEAIKGGDELAAIANCMYAIGIMRGLGIITFEEVGAMMLMSR